MEAGVVMVMMMMMMAVAFAVANHQGLYSGIPHIITSHNA